MSDVILVTIKTPQNEIIEDSQLPGDYDLQMVVDELVDELGLPRLDESAKEINYSLYSKKKGIALSLNNTVESAGVTNGDTIEIQVVGNTASSPPDNDFKPDPPHSPDYDDLPKTVDVPAEINVVLSVMDLNRHETISLPVMHPVGELIRQIVGNYGLPDRDNLNQLIKYKLQSKALGRFLDERTTLLEAQIPPLDRLTLHREEIAG